MDPLSCEEPSSTFSDNSVGADLFVIFLNPWLVDFWLELVAAGGKRLYQTPIDDIFGVPLIGWFIAIGVATVLTNATRRSKHFLGIPVVLTAAGFFIQPVLELSVKGQVRIYLEVQR